MKKAFLVLPLAIALANCSSTHNSTATSASSGVNASTAASGMNADASASGSMVSSGSGSTTSNNGGSNNNYTESGSANSAASYSSNSSANRNNSNQGTNSGSSRSWSNSSTASTRPGTINWDVYDPNNLMMNPEKYRKPYELGKAGGWTYNKDWRRNTNFTADAVGQWQLVLTPEVAANWMPDTRRPETYASFWTPEAVMARYQASMAAAAKTRDSIAALNATANATSSKGRSGKTSMTNRRNGGAADMNGGTWSSGSGTTGTMGTGGLASTNSDANANMTNATTEANNNVTVPFMMTAVNGNNFLLPSLNLYLDNGSFTAYTGCNSAVGNIVVNGSALHFEEATPSTNVECIGGFDQSAFIDRLRRADSYDVVNNQFRLKQGDQVLMVFQKNAQ